jgi:hypothetical protein
LVELRSSAYYDAADDVVRTCLATGEIGYGAQVVFPSSLSGRHLSDASEVAAVVYTASGYDGTGVTPFADVSLSGIEISDAAGGQLVTGNLSNQGPDFVTLPQVRLYPLNTVGRPLAEGFWGDESMAVVPGSSVSFEMNVEGPIEDYVVFHEQDYFRQ